MIESISAVADEVTDIAERFTLAHAALSDAVSDGTQTVRQIHGLRATLSGLLLQLLDLLDDLDATDARDLLVVEEGDRVIAAWKWQRATRLALAKLRVELQNVDRLAEELLEGQRIRTVLVREGDTLQAIAARELGDWKEWPRLIEANPDVDPGTLAGGITLIIPQKR